MCSLNGLAPQGMQRIPSTAQHHKPIFWYIQNHKDAVSCAWDPFMAHNCSHSRAAWS